jgi:DNA-binding transcriptional MerR regulator/methylmalonyl-CoA mutase cobalamin-binding subunit
MNKTPTPDTSRHPIRVVSARTGIPQDLLRAWEKRYQAVVPKRSPTGRRLYSDSDIEKLRLLRRAVNGGRRISDVTSLSLNELKALIEEDKAHTAPAVTGPAGTAPPKNGYFREAITALEEFDIPTLRNIMANAAVSLSNPDLRERVLIPLLHVIGDRWQDGSLRIVHEHIFSVIVRSFVDSLSNHDGSSTASRILITTPSGQRHEFGALMVAAAAMEYGWEAIYLGPDLPAKEIAVAVKQFQPQVLAISIVYNDAGLQLREELKELKRYLDRRVHIIAGGRATPLIKPLLDELNIPTVEDFADFPDLLADLTV